MSEKKPLSNLSIRIITAIIGISILMTLLFKGGEWGIRFFALLVSVASLVEFGSMTFRLSDRKLKTYILAVGGLFLSWVHLTFPQALTGGLSFLFVASFLSYLFAAKDHAAESSQAHVQELFASGFGWIYLGILPLYFIDIRLSESGIYWLILFLIINWVSDTGAYFAGRFFGKHKLYEKVSPKKTIEGTIGGTLLAVLMGIAYGQYFFSTISPIKIGTLVLMVSLVAQMGDLCESLLKRSFQVKDSGGLLPGHGGFLDRFDGAIISAPLMYYWINFILM
ncbi:MAG: hypothetical protein CL678_14125 [Bdellovibrionaceae bacterium]|nr:hypothetical protein [Pseudobdellovibrionaceae bacterium]|tara:strand:- start:2204 stop:3043 length:840 start_codon:yes stop_codon:yes gene_type:complete